MARILVAEDNVILRYAFCEWLREQGHEVLEAASGDEASIILSASPAVDVVTTDLEMPGAMNGLALARYIRDRFPGLPVIMVSGRPPPDETQELGIVAFFRKPYDFEQLSARIADLLPRGQALSGKAGSGTP